MEGLKSSSQEGARMNAVSSLEEESDAQQLRRRLKILDPQSPEYRAIVLTLQAMGHTAQREDGGKKTEWTLFGQNAADAHEEFKKADEERVKLENQSYQPTGREMAAWMTQFEAGEPLNESDRDFLQNLFRLERLVSYFSNVSGNLRDLKSTRNRCADEKTGVRYIAHAVSALFTQDEDTPLRERANHRFMQAVNTTLPKFVRYMNAPSVSSQYKDRARKVLSQYGRIVNEMVCVCSLPMTVADSYRTTLEVCQVDVQDVSACEIWFQGEKALEIIARAGNVFRWINKRLDNENLWATEGLWVSASDSDEMELAKDHFRRNNLQPHLENRISKWTGPNRPHNLVGFVKYLINEFLVHCEDFEITNDVLMAPLKSMLTVTLQHQAENGMTIDKLIRAFPLAEPIIRSIEIEN